jgi:Zn-dependent protease with chaperone function
MNAVWAAFAWVYCDRELWLWIIPFALSINVLLILYDGVFQFPFGNWEPLQGHDPWGVLKIVNEVSEEIKIKRPDVFLIDQPSAQLLCYAKANGVTSRLYITRGAVRLLNPKQLRAALAFQLVAIRSSYNVFNYWMAAILDLLFRIGHALERFFAVLFGWRPPVAAWFICPWMWLVHTLLLGRRDFERLDRETASYLGTPEDLAQALWKMEAYAQTQPWPNPWSFAHMCMVSPMGSQNALVRLARVQPPVKIRINGLTGRLTV